MIVPEIRAETVPLTQYAQLVRVTIGDVLYQFTVLHGARTAVKVVPRTSMARKAISRRRLPEDREAWVLERYDAALAACGALFPQMPC